MKTPPRLARPHETRKRQKKARTFSPWSHLVALLYAQFTHALSLNDVCDTLRKHVQAQVQLRRRFPPIDPKAVP